MPFGKGWPTVRSQAQTRPPALYQQRKETLVQHGYGFLVLRLENEIGCFVRIVEKVVQLIRVPKPVVTDIFETLSVPASLARTSSSERISFPRS